MRSENRMSKSERNPKPEIRKLETGNKRLRNFSLSRRTGEGRGEGMSGYSLLSGQLLAIHPSPWPSPIRWEREPEHFRPNLCHLSQDSRRSEPSSNAAVRVRFGFRPSFGFRISVLGLPPCS